jgi:hypothetical protein
MGGSKKRDVPENKVPLCRECHDLKTLGRIETSVADFNVQGDRHYYYHWRKKNADVWISTRVEVSQRYKCLVLSAAAEVESKLADVNLDATPSAAAPSAGEEENDGEPNGQETDVLTVQEASEDSDVLARQRDRDLSPVRAGARSGVRSERSEHVSERPTPSGRNPHLTHEQRVVIAQEIRDAEWNRQWIAGDTGNAWIAELGEEAEQYLSDFGYVHESLANILRVCAAIKPPYRNGNLRYSHHVVVYELPPEDRLLRLQECEAKRWSVAEFRRQVKGTKPKVKRWTLEELDELLKRFVYESDEESVPYPTGPIGDAVIIFFEWLGDQG